MNKSIKARIKLKSQLKNMVGNIIYQRGVRYFKDGLAYNINIQSSKNSVNKVEITAEVSGTQDYEVGLNFNFKNQSFSGTDCNCPYEYYCKHIVALGLEFTELYGNFLEERETVNFSNATQEKNEFLKWYQKSKGLLIDENEDFDEHLEDGEEVDFEQKAKVEGIEMNFLEKLREAGVDPESLPIDVLKNLAESSKNLQKKEEVQKSYFDVKSRAEKESLESDDQSSRKDFHERYEVILEMGYRVEFKLREKDSYDEYSYYNNYGYEAYQLGDILNLETDTMTQTQKDLLSFWENLSFVRGSFDYETFLKLLQKSGLNVFVNSVDGEKKVEINIDIDPKNKLKASLFTRQQESLLESEENGKITDFIFSLDRRHFERKYSKVEISDTGVMVIDANKISFFKMSKRMIDIVNRFAEERKYYGDYREDIMGISLAEEEIFDLNNLIRDFQETFDLQTELKDDFEIKKFDQPKKVFLVDYNNDESILKIYPAIDYAFYQVPVTQSVKFSRGRYQGYQRKMFRGSYKYIYNVDLEKKTIFYAPVSKQKEINFYKEITAEHERFGFTKTGRFNLKSGRSIFKFFDNGWKEIQNLKYPIIFLNDEINFGEESFKADFDVDFDADKDWLAFDVDCYCGKNKITLETLRSYIESKDEFIKTDDGKFLRVKNKKELEKFVLLLESFHQQESGGKFEGKMYHAPELEDIFTSSNYYNAKLDQGFKQFMKEAKAGKPVEKVKLPVKFKKTLRDYQEEGMNWFYFLRKYRFAGILADDMGLGKTLQALFLMQLNAQEGKPSLVICPKTLLYNWQMEAKKFLPNMKTIVVDGHPKERQEMIEKANENDLIITSYSTLQRDLLSYKKQKIKFNYCVLDEAQFIKNYRTKNARTVKQVDAEYRLALTGTPLENTVEEIWSIFDFLMPGFLGSHKNFSQKFLKPIMKESNAGALKDLRQKTSCFMLRRTKDEVLQELPPKVENVSYCHLDDAQNILYQEILANVKSKIFKTVQEKGFAKSQIHILAGLTKLRQVCNHPALLLKNKDYTEFSSAKLDVFNELVDEIISSDKKVLVFSQFTKMLDILKTDLKKRKIKHLYLSGQTKNRQKLIDEFNAEDSDKSVFLISLKAGGVGLNLTAADNVIIFDPWWNPSVENQAVDRAHRIGQKKSVNVYRLITKGTIEEKIVELQKKKQHLFDNLVGESKDMFKKLTWDDVQDLFR